MGEQAKANVLVFSFPIQGHINPLLQFSKRLLSKNVTVTFLTTSSTHNSILRRAIAGGATALPLSFVPIDDGFEEGHPSTDTSPDYFAKFQENVSRSLSELISSMEPKPNAVVYDSCLPYVLDVCRKHPGVAAASFFTQSSTVNAIYIHFLRGAFKEFQNDVVLPAMPPLKGNDLPVFLYDNNLCRPLFELISSQFVNVDDIDFFLVNSFDELEVEVLQWMKNQWPVKNIGPMIPSMYLDKRIAGDKDYGINLFNAQVNECLDWLDSKPPGSVIYVSFGSLAVLKDDQMIEVAAGLKQTGHNFLWVVRETETKKLPSNYIEEIGEKGLIVNWSPQLQVLAHKSVGCFMTHCGWNSTLEALSLGVALIGMPAYSEQPTNAKFIEDVWKVGVRVKADQNGFVTKEEIVRCVGEVMEDMSEKGKEIRTNARRLMEFAREALSDGGNSDKNIDEFVAKIVR
ncbi:UDP-glucuronosyl/UDP-glucosyltransferase [Arabidopsis thaliana x Arabidopsis arenosa]|uniref:UDP-glucuronosyl/UDP-glucosyltransferase n=1 Tax=Arabidopsis thaliana x Arabidopsis arenosa TaxID=1240361 RepID=A0A8T2A9N6_9BRAS|nr:UDP-glucuronosyl/UDP-glucosyltransferase [Arabidopsis thaliana x Arabidopsis arenosa]